MGSTEVAHLLGVNPATVARAVQAGRLTPSEVTPGGHSRFSEADVEAFRRGRPRRSTQGNVIQLRDLADLPRRIDATVRAKHGIELTESDWRALLERLDHLADAIVEIIERKPASGEAVAVGVQSALPALSPVLPPPELAPVDLPPVIATKGVPGLPGLPDLAPARASATEANADTTMFDDGNSGITLIVQPIERFSLIETISGTLGSIQGVGEIRLRRLQRGVAWFTIRYAGSLPAITVFPTALAALGAEVTAIGERRFEAILRRSEAPVAAGSPVEQAKHRA